MRRLPALLVFAAPMTLLAESSAFLGAFGGVSTLSADGAFVVSGGRSAHAQYKPENGPTLMVFAGRHLNDFVSIQASYGWNRNTVVLSAVESGDAQSAYEQRRRNSHHTVIGEGMLYFRNRRSWVRPYLSAGAGFAHLGSTASGGEVRIGNPVLPPAEFNHRGPAFRVAVGVDVLLRGGSALRYSFSETIQGNPISKQLSPQGQRTLANFQNLFGLCWRF